MGRRDGDAVRVDELYCSDEAPDPLLADLQHHHLPKLVDTGYVVRDEETRTVRRGPQFDEVAPLLRVLHDDRDVLPGDWP
ncbi:ArsR family transcriptional regulator [Salinilacihabitans rarus]|uniref:ArsR family transcriptional regulator n=1 Tax=Salinilacihabitans rarus TaxID=2961596 RepID=UPI0020C919C1|nr:ArsR family transcriptional regulator [Salinilacihabitans rarus]